VNQHGHARSTTAWTAYTLRLLISVVSLVCLNCRGGGYYEMQYITRSLVTSSEL